MVSGFDDIGKQFSILTEVVMWEVHLVEIYFLNDSDSFSLLFAEFTMETQMMDWTSKQSGWR